VCALPYKLDKSDVHSRSSARAGPLEHLPSFRFEGREDRTDTLEVVHLHVLLRLERAGAGFGRQFVIRATSSLAKDSPRIARATRGDSFSSGCRMRSHTSASVRGASDADFMASILPECRTLLQDAGARGTRLATYNNGRTLAPGGGQQMAGAYGNPTH
jgi:hypothetical protein